ncbi:MAG: hypothetical protein LBR84_11150, partial [Tannerella sp.]|nr:hypothetical protein [Tannerella sp.]
MKKVNFLLTIAFVVGVVFEVVADNPERLRRDQSFLGIHFDFHAGPDCHEIGIHTTAAMIDSIIDMVHPDYI